MKAHNKHYLESQPKQIKWKDLYLWSRVGCLEVEFEHENINNN